MFLWIEHRKRYPSYGLGIFLLIIIISAVSCGEDLPERPKSKGWKPDVVDDPVLGVDYFLPDIDLSKWKVTLPVGSPTEVSPPEIMDYATNETLKPFMYNDSTDGSLVFYTYPGSTTTNTSYSRTELRELMNGSSAGVNWTFSQGGRMKGTLSVPEISKDAGGNPHRTIIMQIHGRLTNAQRDLIGQSDNNAPPVLKIYWDNGKILVRTKVMKDLTDTYEESLHEDAWKDDTGRTFSRTVGSEKFSLEVKVSEGRMEVTMDDTETFVYDDVHMDRWGIFENYFKAGNYLVTTSTGAFAKVKYYELEVSHD